MTTQLYKDKNQYRKTISTSSRFIWNKAGRLTEVNESKYLNHNFIYDGVHHHSSIWASSALLQSLPASSSPSASPQSYIYIVLVWSQPLNLFEMIDSQESDHKEKLEDKDQDQDQNQNQDLLPTLQINSLDYRDDIWLDFNKPLDGINLNTYRASAFDWSKLQRYDFRINKTDQFQWNQFEKEYSNIIGKWMLSELQRYDNRLITILFAPSSKDK